MQCVTSVGMVAAGLGRLAWTAPQPPSRSAFCAAGQRSTGHICTGTTGTVWLASSLSRLSVTFMNPAGSSGTVAPWLVSLDGAHYIA